MIITLWQKVLKTPVWKHWEYFNFHSVDFISALPFKPLPPLHYVWSLSPTTHLCLNFILLIRAQLTEYSIILYELSKADRTEANVILFPYTLNRLLAVQQEKPSLCPDLYLILTLSIFWCGCSAFYGSSWQNFTNSPQVLGCRCNYLKVLNSKS